MILNTRPAARFRIRTRPKTTRTPTSPRASYNKHSTTTSRPRSTKSSRRKYSNYSKIESQAIPSTTRHSQQFPRTSPRIPTMTDQALQSTNQQILEDEKTELGHIAFSLLHKAPLPSSARPFKIDLPDTTPATLFPIVTSPRTRYISSTLPVLISSTNRFNIRPPQPPKKQPLKISEGFPQYDDVYQSFLGQLPKYTKVILHSNGVIECLDQGNFPHPASCRKFISCAKMENGKVLGWEYTCPKNLSFDPIGGICNWSAGLGCSAK